MSIQAVLLPLFVQVLLTFGLVMWMAKTRYDDINSRTVHPRDIALRQLNWTPRAQQAGNAYSNQFELPVMFYLLTVLALVTRHADLIFVVLAWVFVLSRLWHAAIHLTTNNVYRRGVVWGVGAIVLFIMWVSFMIRILLGLP